MTRTTGRAGYAGGGVIERRAEFAASCLSMEKIFPVLGRAVQVPDVPGESAGGGYRRMA